MLTLASGLRQMGHHVTLYTSGGPWVSQARRLGVPLHIDTVLQRPGRPKVLRLRRFLQAHTFDIVHAHDGPTMTLAALALRGLVRRPQLVATVHGPYVGAAALGATKGIAKAVITVSPALKPKTVSATRLPAGRVYTIPNGIRTDLFRPGKNKPLRKLHKVPEDAYVIGYAGRFTVEKAALGRRVVRSLKRFSLAHKRVYVLVVGRESKRIVGTSRGRVKVLGPMGMGKMPDFYNSCDLVIGTARVAAESAICGVPTMAVGSAGDHGLVTQKSLRHMIQTNFGDHGAVRPWTHSQLNTKLSHAMSKQRMLKHEAGQVRKALADQLSSHRMIRRILRVYRLAISTK